MALWLYVARRLAVLVPTLFFVSVLIFSLQQLLPGDAAIAMAGEENDPEAIAAIQGAPVDAMHVLLGIGERRTLRPDDFTAYYRRVRDEFLTALARGAATEPYRVEHCGLCEFRSVCEERWVREDHLLLVAGIRREHVTRLRAAGLPTLAKLASAPDARVDQIAAPTFEFFALYGTAAIYYWVICLVLSFGQSRLERRLERHVAR